MIFRREETPNLTNEELFEKVQKEVIESKRESVSVLIICSDVIDVKKNWVKVAREKYNLYDFIPKGFIDAVGMEYSGLKEKFGDTNVTIIFKEINKIKSLDDIICYDYVLNM